MYVTIDLRFTLRDKKISEWNQSEYLEQNMLQSAQKRA